MKTKKKSGKTLRKSGKSQGKIREFDGIKEVGTLLIVVSSFWKIIYLVHCNIIFQIKLLDKICNFRKRISNG